MANITGKIYAEIILKLDKLKASKDRAILMIKQFGSATRNVSVSTEQDAKKMQAAWAAGYAVISAAAIRAARKVVSAFTDMVDVYAKFEQSLANTQSVARASAEELDAMEQAARRVGATTRSTASEAANALYYLASAGFTAKESIAALDGVNALAIATQSDLAKTSETVATVIKQYGLETGKATDIANTFTAAITSSLATMDKLAKSFEYVGPIAAGLGLTVEETTGALELLYNKGFSGEKAGRGLRTILINLADSTSVVNKKLAKLGITFNEINPATRSLAEIIDTLREKNVDATNAAAIFGKVSGVQLQALIAQASDAKGGIIELTNAVTGTSRAFEAMDIQMDTLQGSSDKFKNAEEALKITTGKGLEPILRGIIDTATDFVKILNELPQNLLSAIAVIGTATAGGTALAIAITAGATALSKLGIIAAASIPTLGPLAAGITAVTLAIMGLIAAGQHAKKVNVKLFGDLAEEMNLTEKETKKFYVTARMVRDKAGFIKPKDVKDVQSLRNELSKLADDYGLTIEQTLRIAETNETFAKRAGITIALLKGQLATEEELARVQARGAEAQHDHFTKTLRELELVLAKEKELVAKNRERNTAEAYEGLTDAFAKAHEYQKLLGNDYDRNAALSAAFLKAQKLLIEQGLSAESDEVQDLIKLYTKLQDKYGKVVTTKSNELTDTERRKAVQEDIKQQLAEIGEKEKLALKYNQEYNAEKARSEVVLNGINELIVHGFTIEGVGIQKILKEYGKYIEQKEIISTLANDYIAKLNDLLAKQDEEGKTAIEIAEIHRKAALEKAADNQAAIDAINNYYDTYEKVLKLTIEKEKREKEAAEAEDLFVKRQIEADKKRTAELRRIIKLADDYDSKLAKLGKSDLDTIEMDRQRALSAAEGYDWLIDKINEYYDELRDDTAMQQFVTNMDTAVSTVLDTLNAINTIYSNMIKQQIELEQQALAAKLDVLDQEEQAALVAAGVAEQTEREKLEVAVQAAQDQLALDNSTANQQALIDAENALKRYDIHQEYLDKKHKAEIDSANKIAQLNYEADLQQWHLDIITATANAALAALKALADTGNPIYAAAVATVGALQVGAVKSAEPQPPVPLKYADGGIVPGSSYKGDVTPILANAGELILNQAQQDTVAQQLTDNSQPIYITIQTLLDGKVVAINSAKYYKNGQVKL